ncbi:MAG: molybdopterin-binding protein [Pseudomonadota bacterium]
MTNTSPTAAVLLIGDEILSGRTQDVNLKQIADFLTPYGIPVKECRTVPDVEEEIVAGVNALRARYTYVFTTGGIGPTHDDITADSIGAAFGVEVDEHPEIIEILAERYKSVGREFNPASRRMARVPKGAVLVKNTSTGAPGFRMDNVFILAGVPSIAQAMLQALGPQLETGAVVHSITVRGIGAVESDIASGLTALAEEMGDVSLGSYPWFKTMDDRGVNLVARSTDEKLLDTVSERMIGLFAKAGIDAELVSGAG